MGDGMHKIGVSGGIRSSQPNFQHSVAAYACMHTSSMPTTCDSTAGRLPLGLAKFYTGPILLTAVLSKALDLPVRYQHDVRHTMVRPAFAYMHVACYHTCA
jgi:hypothetical protein